ncbi:laccase 3 [Coprinopsis cinerea AmutBmut pab1-1]|nr:laccase 3 [Coprinopsis cinerea AmutBmut pab1-1]
MVSLSSSFKFLSQFALFSAVLAADVYYTFDIVNANLAPDGFTRPTVVVNGQFPGTLIQANKDDVLHITVNNLLTNPLMRRSTAIHWHGLFQKKTASEDGPAGVTQCPISPGHSYTYDIPLNGQAGTHCHLSSQYVDGLRGPIVIYDPTDPHLSLYDEDDENTIIQLGDWYHNPAPAIQEDYLNDITDEPVPDSGTINGVGRYRGGPAIPWARVNVVQGKRYRLRVINNSAYGSFEFSIENHDLTIIEVDGINHVPKTVGGFEIYAGQRYSVVIDANKPIRNYWIRAPMDVKDDSPTLDDENIYAVLHYEGAPNANPTTRADRSPSNVLKEHELVPLDPGPPGGCGPADKIIDLQYSRDTSGTTKWKFNGVRYHSPTDNTLLNIMGGATIASDFTPSEHTLILNHNDIVEIHLHGSSNGHVHPFHLHGHAFDIIQGRSGGSNCVNPPRRDVVGLTSGTGIIRFKADNPGPWFLHCHIDWHLEAGLAVVFAEAPDEQRTGPQSQIIKQEWLDLCPIYNALSPDLQ